MAISFTPVSIGTTATILPAIPPGPCQVSFSGTAAVFLGGSAVTAATGFQVPAGVPYTITQFTGSAPTQIYGVAATAVVLNFMLNTDR